METTIDFQAWAQVAFSMGVAIFLLTRVEKRLEDIRLIQERILRSVEK